MAGEAGLPAVKERASLVVSMKVLWICLGCAVVLDVLGVFKGLGFAPSFQLEAQPLFFLGVVATAFVVIRKGRLGPLLAGMIFWIPIVFLFFELVITRDVIPFGGDIVGIGELIVAVVGVLAAHNVYHKFGRGWLSSTPGGQ